MKKMITMLLFAVSTLLLAQFANAHCQIPCGIYDDYARVQAMLEDVTTLEKSVTMINELVGKTDAQSSNQMVRWVMNKEDHAQKIIDTISNYFLTQRVKDEQEDYAARLAKHHAVIVAAMKVKQNTEQSYVQTLKADVEALKAYYPEHTHK